MQEHDARWDAEPEAAPPGFTRIPFDRAGLFVPLGVQHALALQARTDAARAAEQALQARLPAAQKRGEPTPAPPSNPAQAARPSSNDELQAWLLDHPRLWEGRERGYRHHLKAYEPAALCTQAAARLAHTRERVDREAIIALVQRLADRGPWRRLRRPARPQSRLAALRADMPHFGAVISLLQESFALMRYTGKTQRLPPLLLLGPPGVGKSFFAEQLARLLAVPVLRVNMEQEQNNSALCGTDLHWANHRPGALFNLLADSPTGNPVVVVEELDKVQQSERYRPEQALLGLLEPHTAERFTDLGTRIALNASHITWIATANSTRTIEAPLLSRWTVVQVDALDDAACRATARAVWRQLQFELELGAQFAPPSEEVYARLAGLSARQQRQRLLAGVRRAIAQEREALHPQDVDEGQGSGPRADRRIGFL
ncbi:MAG: AAA family ATPase [Betaproteobacteria bacterium]|nr:AAA family ATPase [Betaproteobacteria bacterium]MDE2047085.1 AAA family ATPase [Betaproteobacteria bacterium]